MFYNADTEAKELSSAERLQIRQTEIKPLVEDFLAWVKQQLADGAVPPKSETAKGLRYVVNQ